MTLKLELNDWEVLAVEVALVTLQEKWIEEEKDYPALKAGMTEAQASLQTLIDKVWAISWNLRRSGDIRVQCSLHPH